MIILKILQRFLFIEKIVLLRALIIFGIIFLFIEFANYRTLVDRKGLSKNRTGSDFHRMFENAVGINSSELNVKRQK